MRKILLRTANGGSWRPAEEASFKNEAQLQELLYADPSLIPFEDLGEDVAVPRVFVREAGLPGSGSTDLIGVDETGGICIIECKLATNPEQKRKVVGQVLEYAAFLWRMRYDRFERLFDKEVQKSSKTGLADLVAPAEDEEWSEAEFRGSVESTMENGNFLLIIAVDALNDELRRTIEYLNRGQQNGTTINAVEVGYFIGDGFEVLSPRILGPTAKQPPPPWDEPRFFNAASKQCSPGVVALLRNLYDFTVRESDRWRWGKGQDGSFTFIVERDGAKVSVFSAFTSGRIWLNLGFLKGVVSDDVLARFARELSQLQGMADVEAHLETQQFPVYVIEDALPDASAAEVFKAAVRRVRDSLEA